MEEGEVVKIRIQALSDKIVELERKVKEQRKLSKLKER